MKKRRKCSLDIKTKTKSIRSVLVHFESNLQLIRCAFLRNEILFEYNCDAKRKLGKE